MGTSHAEGEALRRLIERAYDVTLGIIEVARTESPETAFSRVMLQRARTVRDELEAALAPLSGPVDASGEPTGRAETRAVVQLAQAFKDDRDDLGITSRAVMARWILDHAAAVPSSPAQEKS